MRLLILLFSTTLSVNVAFSHSDESTSQPYKVGRYSSVSTEPTSAQQDLLSVIIQLDFPRSIQTVGSAITILLLNSGYRLADLKVADPSLAILLDSPLPSVHRSLGPISLRKALTTLSGKTWDLIVDPVHRLVSFDLIEKYKFSFDDNEVVSHN